jgi:hypothetical protein
LKDIELGSRTTGRIISTLKAMAHVVGMNTIFVGINEVPSTATPRGGWFKNFLDYIEQNSGELGSGAVTFVDCWTPTSTQQIELRIFENKLVVKEANRTIVQEYGRLTLLEQAVRMYMTDNLSHDILGRPKKLDQPASPEDQADQSVSEAEDEPEPQPEMMAEGEEGGDGEEEGADPDVIIENVENDQVKEPPTELSKFVEAGEAAETVATQPMDTRTDQ